MILFCDFDGVLHPASGSDQFNQAHRMGALLRDFPHIDVVLSTSWREGYPYDVLRNVFGEDLSHRVIGKTPVISQKEAPFRPYVRYREIQLWLQHHTREAKRGHVILDDDRVQFPPDCPSLILCDPATGIDDRVEGLLREWFLVEAKNEVDAG